MKTILILLVLAVAWDVGWAVYGVDQTLPWQLRSRLEAGEPATLIDVRTPAEYGWFHIPGAVNVPFGEADSFERILELTKSRQEGGPVVVLCMTGHRSPLVARKLMQMGVQNVSNLTWGTLGYRLFGGGVE